jgi:hypothetical protein
MSHWLSVSRMLKIWSNGSIGAMHEDTFKHVYEEPTAKEDWWYMLRRACAYAWPHMVTHGHTSRSQSDMDPARVWLHSAEQSQLRGTWPECCSGQSNTRIKRAPQWTQQHHCNDATVLDVKVCMQRSLAPSYT